MKRQIVILAGCSLIFFALAACDSGTEGPPEALQPPTTSEGSGDEVAANTPPVVEPAPEPEPLPSVPDYQIVTRIRTRFLSDELVRPLATTIVVSANEGVVTLSGQSDSAAGRARAEAIAAATYGVSEVTNTIEAPEGDAGEAGAVPAEILAVEPQFAHAARNYETDEVVRDIQVISRANPRGVATTVTPDLGEPIEPVVDELDPTGVVEDSGTTPALPTGDSAMPSGDSAMPTGDSAAPSRPDSGGATYVVQDGDTLWSIAQGQMGAGSRWEELFQANSELMGGDPDRLRAGMELVIPR